MLANIPLLYPLKTSENQRFSDVFRGYRNGTLDENGKKHLEILKTKGCEFHVTQIETDIL